MAKTTRERRQARTREQILDAAQALILEEGFDRLSLRAVARKVDYSPAGLYEYFDSKEAIIAELAMRAGVRLTRVMREAAKGGQAPELHPLVRLGLSYIDFARSFPEDFQLLFTRLRSQRQQHEDAIQADSPYLTLKQEVELSVSKGSIALPSGRSIDDIAYSIWSLCHGAAMLQITHLQGYQADFDAVDRYALEALLEGLNT